MERKDFDGVTERLRQRAEEETAPSPQSSAHLRTLYQQIDAIARGDIATVLEHVTEDVTLEIFAPPEFPFVRLTRGAEPFRRALEHNFAVVEDQRPEVKDLFVEGEKIVMFGRETGTLRANGMRYDVEFVERFTFRNGLLAAVRIIVAHTRLVAD